ncbi:MAG TPA: hypothetical protein VNI01_10405, partial [Elusimicrobiota bacterium]|nr:hypothetical protein [Elusimicrobiota bacterium]
PAAAAAAARASAVAPTGPTPVPALGASLSATEPALALPSLDANLAPAALPTVDAAALSLQAPPASIQVAAPQAALEAAAVAGAERAADPGTLSAAIGDGRFGREASAAPALESGARGVSEARGDGGKTSSVLGALFQGSRAGFSDAGAVLAAAQDGAAAAAPGLAAATPDALADLAIDSSKPESERRAAVAALADRGDAAQAALNRNAEANPEGGAADYEVHRAALRLLAERFGDLRSLRPISRAHADQILAQLSANKPALAVFDQDGTLEDHSRGPMSPETAAALAAAAGAGVTTAILSFRVDEPRFPGDKTLLTSLEGLTPAQKASLIVAADSGGRVFLYDKTGAARKVAELPPWTAAEESALASAIEEIQGKWGAGSARGASRLVSPYHALAFLAESTDAASLEAARLGLEAALARRGIRVDVIGQGASPGAPARLIVSKHDKRAGVALLRERRDGFKRLQDVLRLGLPFSWLQRALRLLPSRTVPAERTLVVGDYFFPPLLTDARMTKGAPGALAIAVGGQADPRIDNAFLWPVSGKAASLELLKALAPAPKPASPSAEHVNLPRTVAGIFAQRTVSIIAFLLISIAYPFIAVKMVGWDGYGTLMTLSTMTAIATGTINGIMVDKFSPRNAMLINTAIRIALLSILPAAWALGVLNFPILAVAAMAEGYLLSSIMTTENAFIRRVIPGNRIQTMSDFALMNFYFLQVLFGRILGIGHVADVVSPIAVYAAAAAANLLLVLPIIWFTIPNIAPASQASAASPAPLAARIGGFFKKYWLEASLFAASVAAFPFIGTPILMVGALVFWIVRSERFQALWRGDYTEPVKDGAPAPKRLRAAMLYLALGALIFYPIQYLTLAKVAEVLAGAAGKGLLHGQFLGSLFLGNLISLASRADPPSFWIPVFGTFNTAYLVKAVVLSLVFTWIVTSAVPGSILAGLAAAALAAGLMALASRVTDRGWLQLLGVGFAAIWLPYV